MAKRKQGKRTKDGRLSRAGKEPSIVRPSEWVAAQIARYGQHYTTPIGRAYASGLLGEGDAAKDRLSNATRYKALYGRFYGKPGYRCALDQSPRGMDAVEMTISKRQANDHKWLRVNMKRVDLTGCEPFMDQLLSDLFADSGPSWLQALLDTKACDRHPADVMVLQAAIKAIDAIGPVERANVIHEYERAA